MTTETAHDESPTQLGVTVTRENRGGYSFVANVLDVRIELPVSISPALRLQAASDPQILQVKRLLHLGGLPIEYYFQHEWTPYEQSDGLCHRAVALPRDQWRYFVIAWAGHGVEIAPFQKAVNLVPPGILCYSQVFTSDPFGAGDYMGHKFESVSIPDTHLVAPPKLLTVDAEHIRDWQTTLAALARLDHGKHPGIVRAVDSLEKFGRLPLSDDLRILGWFMVLEMLLTHNPNDKEIGDSLSHQICTKVALLNSRLTQLLNYRPFGAQVTEERVWKTLYAFRSASAHGGVADFKKKLHVLKSPQIASDFLADATARILRHALEEPVLFDSLKPV